MNEADRIIGRVVHWIESAVIGLNLCPFAESVFKQRRINYTISESRDIEALMFELYEEVDRLQESDDFDTTLLIIPSQLLEFEDYNESLNRVDALLEANAWTGEFQIASFHPYYRFQDTQYDARENWSNRSPYPIYQILRESSVTSATKNYPGTDQIPVNNIHTLNSLTKESFERIFLSNHRE